MRFGNLVPFIQFKERQKHSWSSVTLLKARLLHGFFHVFKISQVVSNRAKRLNYLISKINEIILSNNAIFFQFCQ